MNLGRIQLALAIAAFMETKFCSISIPVLAFYYNPPNTEYLPKGKVERRNYQASRFVSHRKMLPHDRALRTQARVNRALRASETYTPNSRGRRNGSRK